MDIGLVNQIVKQYGALKVLKSFRSPPSEEQSERSENIVTQYSSFDRIKQNIDTIPSCRRLEQEYHYEEFPQTTKKVTTSNELKSIILSLTKENHKLKQLLAQQRNSDNGDSPSKAQIKPQSAQTSKKKAQSFSLRSYEHSQKNSFFDRSPQRIIKIQKDGAQQQCYIQQNYYLISNKQNKQPKIGVNHSKALTNPYLSDCSNTTERRGLSSYSQKRAKNSVYAPGKILKTPQQIYIEQNYFMMPTRFQGLKQYQNHKLQQSVRKNQQTKYFTSNQSYVRTRKLDSDELNYSH